VLEGWKVSSFPESPRTHEHVFGKGDLLSLSPCQTSSYVDRNPWLSYCHAFPLSSSIFFRIPYLGGMNALPKLGIRRPRNSPILVESSPIDDQIISVFEESGNHAGESGSVGLVKRVTIPTDDGVNDYIVKRGSIVTREQLKVFTLEADICKRLSQNPLTSRYVPKYVSRAVLGNYGYIVQVYEPVVELLSHLNHLSKARAFFSKEIGTRIYEELVRAVKAFHDAEILHNDIKPENILLKLDSYGNPTGDVLLIDFGTACYGSPCYDSDIKGSVEYWPNFVQTNANLRSPYNKPTENYSLGKVLYYIVDFTEGIVREDYKENIERNFFQPGLQEYRRRKLTRSSSPNGNKSRRKNGRTQKHRSR